MKKWWITFLLFVPLEMKSGKLKPAAGDNPNTFFLLVTLKSPFISDKVELTPLILTKTELYDFNTKAGMEYTLTLVH